MGAGVTLLVDRLDVLVAHGPEAEPLLAVIAHKYLLVLAQVVVVEVDAQAATNSRVCQLCHCQPACCNQSCCKIKINFLILIFS